MVWYGIGLPAEGTDPDDGPDDGDPDGNPPREGKDPPLSGGRAENPPRLENPIPITKTADREETAEDSGANFGINSSKKASRSGYTKNPPQPSAPSAPVVEQPSSIGEKRRLTPDQAREAQKLIAEGMSPKWARAEVLGTEV
jgi:hypothetical protein